MFKTSNPRIDTQLMKWSLMIIRFNKIRKYYIKTLNKVI